MENNMSKYMNKSKKSTKHWEIGQAEFSKMKLLSQDYRNDKEKKNLEAYLKDMIKKYPKEQALKGYPA